MKPPAAAEPPAPESEDTGLPWLRTWPRVYLLVLACFALWVGLLVALTLSFS